MYTAIEKHAIWYVLVVIFVVRFSICADETQNEMCKKKILEVYKDAKCYLAKNATACKRMCEKRGAEACKEAKGEIRKLHCKELEGGNKSGVNQGKSNEESNESDEKKKDEWMTCCCTVKCEDNVALLGKCTCTF